MKFVFSLLFALLITRHSTASNLDGTWIQHCQQGNFRSETFRERIVIFEEHFFTDAECRAPAVRFRVSGSFVARANEIDFRADAHEIVPASAAIAADFNQRRVCGRDDWTLGQARVVSGRACDVFRWGQPMRVPAAGTWTYGIWKLEDGLLYFGRLTPDRDGTSPARRPTAWNPRFFRKID